MAITCTVAGVDRTAWAKRASFSIVRSFDNPDTLTLTFRNLDESAGYRPEPDDLIVVTEDAATLFAGFITTPDESGFSVNVMAISALGYGVYPRWRYVTMNTDLSEPPLSTTLKAALTSLVSTYLACYGVTLATMADGPTVEAMTAENMRCDEVLNQYAKLAGDAASTGPWYWSISPTKVLSMVSPGSTAAPFAVTDAGTAVRGEPTLKKSRDGYADLVRIICGPNGLSAVSQSWVVSGYPYAVSWTTEFKAADPPPTYVAVAITSPPSLGYYSLRTATPYGIVSNAVSPSSAIASSSAASQTEITTTDACEPSIGEEVVIAGHSGGGVNGTRTVLQIITNKRFIIDVASTGGTGGTATIKRSVVTTSKTHPFVDADQVTIRDHTQGSVPDINGVWTILKLGDTTFSIPVVCTNAGTAGGTVYESAADYLWDKAAHTLYVDQGTPPPDGAIITLTYTALFPFTVISTAGSATPREIVLTAPNVLSKATGQALADLERARRSIVKKEFAYRTATAGLAPNQLQATQCARRGIANSTDYLVTRVEDRFLSNTRHSYQVTSTEGTFFLGGAVDFWKRLAGGAGGSGGSGAGATTISGPVGIGSVTVLSSPYLLANNRGSSWLTDGASWYDAVDWSDFVAYSAFTARVRVSLWARTAIAVTARLYDSTAAAAAGTSSAVTATSPYEVTFNAALVAGHRYRLQCSTAVVGSFYCIGRLEAL